MAIPFEKMVKDDVNFGYGPVTVTMPGGGTAISEKIGLHLFTGWVNVKDFGAVGDSITDDRAAIQAAIDALPRGTGSDVSQGGVVYFPPGWYRLASGSLTLRKNVKLLGPTSGAAVLANNGTTSGQTQVLVTTVSGGGGLMEIAHLAFQVNHASEICVQFKGVDRCNLHHCDFLSPSSGLGTHVQLDQNGVSGAYGHHISHCRMINGAKGIELINGGTTTLVHGNHIVADAAIIESDGTGGFGSNLYVDNVLQSRAAHTGNGIDIAGTTGGDDWCVGNYIEGFLNGIIIRAGSVRNKIIAFSWENNTNNISDLTTNQSGASVVDLFNGVITLGVTNQSARLYIAGDPTLQNIGLRMLDTRGGGRGFSLVNGFSSAGVLSVRDDTAGVDLLRFGTRGLDVGATGSWLQKMFYQTGTFTPGTLNANETAGHSFTVTGAQLGYPVVVGASPALPGGCLVWGVCDAVNTVTVYAHNANGGGAPFTLPATTFQIFVLQPG